MFIIEFLNSLLEFNELLCLSHMNRINLIRQDSDSNMIGSDSEIEVETAESPHSSSQMPNKKRRIDEELIIELEELTPENVESEVIYILKYF